SRCGRRRRRKGPTGGAIAIGRPGTEAREPGAPRAHRFAGPAVRTTFDSRGSATHGPNSGPDKERQSEASSPLNGYRGRRAPRQVLGGGLGMPQGGGAPLVPRRKRGDRQPPLIEGPPPPGRRAGGSVERPPRRAPRRLLDLPLRHPPAGTARAYP